jgi:serralysin
MASVVGGLFQPSSGHGQVSAPQGPTDAGRLSLASLTEHTTIAGGRGSETVPGSGFGTLSGGAPVTVGGGLDTVSSGAPVTVVGGGTGGGAPATVGGGSGTVGSGFDTVSGPGAGGVAFAGQVQGGTDQVVATQTVVGGNTILTLPDGSTITLVGVTHIDASFVH